MSGNFGDFNPYASPPFAPEPPTFRRQVEGKVKPPAIVLIVAAVLGLGFSLFNVAFSFTEPQVDPNAPEFLREMQQGAVGPVAGAIQGAFAAINLLVLVGAVQMMRLKMWGLAVAASVVAMVNFGSCCCVLGLPVGIWSLVVLLSPEVKAAFAAPSR
ncbi:MAG TPA: hypothetical protein VFV87_17265 [Pirellulaceae bacterium]|nr:hypothetical protein [Pirellulaceae bacterium]